MPNLDRIKAAQLEDAERLSPPGFWRRLDTWTHRFDRIGRWLKSLAKAVGYAGSLLAAGAGAWRYMKNREVAPAELPKTGVASTFADRVEKPKAP